MAHYAILDTNNIVTQVIVGKDENEELPEGYASWEQYYGGLRTSYNTFGNQHNNNGNAFRGNYAGVGYKYDQDFDVFIAPQPYLSWKLNYTTFQWQSPVAMPEEIEGFIWKWSESNKEWISVNV
jgi:hypothetical protein